MIQQVFAEHVAHLLRNDERVLGLAVGGSWLTGELDAFSDLDLIVVTHEKVGGQAAPMLAYAERFGKLLNGFTGEHVGEPRVLICLYEDPLLHVDIKFLTIEELAERVEDPAVLLDKEGMLAKVLAQTKARFPLPNYGWIEDRFWIWVHYALLKIGRGENLEALDFLGYLRMSVLGPLLHLRNGNLPRGVRKVETLLQPEDRERLLATVPAYHPAALLQSLEAAVKLYRSLRSELFPEAPRQTRTELAVMDYFQTIRIEAEERPKN